MPGSRSLDLAASPRDNLYACGKTWGTFGDDPIVSTFHGAMYASVGTRRLQPRGKSAIRAHTEQHHPELFEAPADWAASGPILSSWEAYARATPPEA